MTDECPGAKKCPEKFSVARKKLKTENFNFDHGKSAN